MFFGIFFYFINFNIRALTVINEYNLLETSRGESMVTLSLLERILILYTLLTFFWSRFSTYSEFGEFFFFSKKPMFPRIEISLVFKCKIYVKYSTTFNTSSTTDRFNMVRIYFSLLKNWFFLVIFKLNTW